MPYTVHPVDVFGEDPNAKVPVITDHDGPGGRPYTLSESGTILLYLAEKTGQLLPNDLVAKFDAIQCDDGADDPGRPDVRAVCALHALRAQGE